MDDQTDASREDVLQQELNGANRLAEFRLQKIIELQDEVVRLRRLLLTMRGGSEKLQRDDSTLPRRNSSVLPVETITTTITKTPTITKGAEAAPVKSSENEKIKRQRRSNSYSPSPLAVGGRTGVSSTPTTSRKTRYTSSPSPRTAHTNNNNNNTINNNKGKINNNDKILVGTRGVSPKPRLPSVASSAPSVSGSRGNSTRKAVTPSYQIMNRPPSPSTTGRTSQSRATTRPLIKLHTGVQLRGPKTFRRAPPPLVHVDPFDIISCSAANNTTSTTAAIISAAASINSTPPPSPHVCSSLSLRRERDSVREALAMLRGIVLRADRGMLSTLTILSNRRGLDRAMPTALAEFKQCLIRVHPALSEKLQDGEAWRIDEAERDALEVSEVPGMATALRDLVITYDYTACVHQQALQQDDGNISAQLGKSFHEFYANMYVLLALAQCPAALR